MTLIKLDKPALVLRTCNADMTAPYDNRFLWPESGYIEAPDWRENTRCGYGLHGALWGEGDAGLFSWAPDAKWLVVEVDHYIELQGKVKFKGGTVVHTGDKASATAYLHAHRQGRIIGLTLTGGDGSTLTGGDGSTLTGGYGSTLTGGDGSTLTGGNRSTLTGGNRSTLTGGDGSTLTGGDGSTLLFRRYDYSAGRYRGRLVEMGDTVGDIVIEAGKPYRCTDSGVIVPA